MTANQNSPINPGTPAQLIASLKRHLPKALPTTATAATPGNDLYEAYLFGLILHAARQQGYHVDIQDSRGRPASAVHLRRSPGRLCNGMSRSGTPFTHAVLTVGSRPPLEVHTGIKVIGKSRVAHEADVLVLGQEVAARCRTAYVDPASSSAHLVMEAKFYTSPVTIRTGREFLGLRHDLSAKHMVFVSTVADATTAALIAGSNLVDADDGVLPSLVGEASLVAYLVRFLRQYKKRR